MDIIKVEYLTKSFRTINVLRDLSMNVHHRDIYGFLGPNGSGKTTTLRILTGLLVPDSGCVYVLNINPASSAITLLRQKINMLPESHGVYGWMTTIEYLSFFARLYGVTGNSAMYSALLDQVGLDPSDNCPIRAFSTGMKQRLGIARTLVNKPDILFLDEPTNGLDPRGRREIHDLLLRLNQELSITIVLSTHILDDVERLCNRIGILFEGKLQYEGSLTKDVEQTYLQYTDGGVQ